MTGLALADVRARLTGPLPRVLHIEADADRAREIAGELEALGFGVISCDPRAAPTDGDRLQARALRFAPGRLWVTGGHAASDDHDQEVELPFGAIALIQQGVRTTTSTEVTKTSARRLDLTRALLSGGLLLTKKVDTKTTRTTTAREGFLLLHRADGEPDVIVYERRLDYRFLGDELQPSSTGNFDRLRARLRAACPRVLYDARVAKPGFLSGLPVSPLAALDVALWMVHLAHLRGLLAADAQAG